jgi:hypothetical protein
MEFVEDLAEVWPTDRADVFARETFDAVCVKAVAMMSRLVAFVGMDVVVPEQLPGFVAPPMERLVAVQNRLDPRDALSHLDDLLSAQVDFVAVGADQLADPEHGGVGQCVLQPVLDNEVIDVVAKLPRVRFEVSGPASPAVGIRWP